jgi:hypothetical protein
MLEYIYDDIVRKHHFIFLNDYKDEDSFFEIEQKLANAKQTIRLEKLEFYLSTFFHHL